MSAALSPKPLRVVIIDDTADLRELLSLALTRGGFDVVAEAGDGQQGIEVVRTERPDVVLLDLSMPIMDGLEALPMIRRLCPKGKIVVLSGFGATQMSARAMAAGADGYVQKGASLTSILEYVRGVTTGRPVRAPRSLSVVPPTSGAADAVDAGDAGDAVDVGNAEGLETPESQTMESTPPAAGRNVSAWEALSMAPFGILELADEPLFRIVYANSMAQRLLVHRAGPGTPLGVASVGLASLVSYHRLDADASFELELEGRTVRATLRRTGWSLVVYLDSTADDVGMLRRAIATTAHEIRGPVAVINGIAETMEWTNGEMDPAQRKRLMTSVARQARMLDTITADLLTAAQIQRGTLRIDLQPVHPQSIIESIITDRYDVAIEIQDDRQVRADPLRLEQILSNLLVNAHKYGKAPYHVRVRSAGESVSIDVIDNGDGVPMDFRDELFREFARASRSVATGSGLGLYVVRTLAEAQNGTVSYTPGEYGGSHFTVTLRAI